MALQKGETRGKANNNFKYGGGWGGLLSAACASWKVVRQVTGNQSPFVVATVRGGWVNLVGYIDPTGWEDSRHT